MKRICIIGGGFSGMATAIQLLGKSDDVSIEVVNEGHPVTQGIAYSTSRPEHLLNVHVGNMSFFPDEPDHFVNWLKASHHLAFNTDLIRQTYVPRSIYGQYLNDLTLPFLKDRKLNIIPARAISIKKQEAQYRLILNNDSTVICDVLVLAIGNFLPATPEILNDKILSEISYFPDPWNFSFTDHIQKDQPVLLLGSGLTMIDCMLSLLSKGHSGKIYSVSPRGYLPEPHLKGVFVYPDFYPEIKGIGLNQIFSFIKKQLNAATLAGIPWQAVIDRIRPHAKEIWTGLSEQEKQRFISHLRHIWGVGRHRLPASVHARVVDLLASGQLEVIGGRLESIIKNKKEISVSIRLRKESKIKTMSVSCIVNCTGPQLNYSQLDDPFVKSLLAENMIFPHPLKMGIQASAEGNVINKEAARVNNVYAVGSLLRAVLWETTSVPDLRANAENVAKQIIGSIN